MKLKNRTRNHDERGRSGFRAYAPLLSGIALSAALALLPFNALAQTYTCSAKLVNRPMTTFQEHKMNRGKVTGLKLFVPGGKGKRIEIAVPDNYVNHLAVRAKKVPEKQREGLIRGELQKSIEGGIAALRSKTSATFTCGQAPAPPVAPAKSTAAPAAKSSPSLRDPLPPIRKGGSGSESSPYVVQIPIPYGQKKGIEITSSSLDVRPFAEGKSSAPRIHFKLTFVTDPQTDKSYRSDPGKLSQSVASLMASTATTHIRKSDRTAQPVSSSSLNGDVLRTIRGIAQSKTESVGRYLGFSGEPQKRRRTLGGI